MLVKESSDETFIEKLYKLIKAEILTMQNKWQKDQILSQLEKMKNQQRYAFAQEVQDHQDADKLLDDLFFNQ